jgi:uncharacterized protein YegP (UPF0339 family)
MYFKIKKSVDGQFYFTVYADNHEPLCHSENYVAKQSALDAIAVIKREAAIAPTQDTTDNRMLF